MLETRTQKQFVGPKHPWDRSIDRTCFLSSKLYHVGLHLLLEIWNYNQDNYKKPGFQRRRIPSLPELVKLLKPTLEYQRLPAKVAQATVKMLHDDWKSFEAAWFDFWEWTKSKELQKQFPKKYKACPQPPGFKGDKYIRRTDSRKPVKFTYQTMSGGQIIDSDRKQVKGARLSESIAPKGIITLCPKNPEFKQEIPFTLHMQPQVVTDANGKQAIKKDSRGKPVLRDVGITEVRYIPIVGGYNVEVVYNEEITGNWTAKQEELQAIASFDLGLNVTAAGVIEGNPKPIAFNGWILKSLLLWSYYQIEELKRDLYWSKPARERQLIDERTKAKEELELKRKRLRELKDPESNPFNYLMLGLMVQQAFATHSALYPDPPEYDQELGQILTSKIPQNSSKRIQAAYNKLRNRLDHYLHNVSSTLVKLLVEKGVVILVIGRNLDWKQFAKGMKNFTRLPFNRFVEMLTYKCVAVGITVHLQNESHTSKGSAMDGDYLPPCYVKGAPSPHYSGTRVRRGLYITAKGIHVHSDVQSSVNVLRKFKTRMGLPTVDQDWVKKVLTTPFKIQIQKDSRLIRGNHYVG